MTLVKVPLQQRNLPLKINIFKVNARKWIKNYEAKGFFKDVSWHREEFYRIEYLTVKTTVLASLNHVRGIILARVVRVKNENCRKFTRKK